MRASRSPDHAVGPLLGRAREHAAVESVLARARKSESAVLLVRGERETGKTELVEHAVRSAGGMRVLRARGFEAEAVLRFSALAELLRPLLGLLDRLPPPQRAALEAALALGPPVRPDRFAVSVATLGLLAAAAAARPLAVLVDDAHYLDAESGQALAFAARRLAREPIAVVVAAQRDLPCAFDGSGFAEISLDAPDDGRARPLVVSTAGVEAASLRSLTARELQVAKIVARGATNEEAAAALFLSPKTIEFHLHNVYGKLGLRSRAELAALLARAAP